MTDYIFSCMYENCRDSARPFAEKYNQDSESYAFIRETSKNNEISILSTSLVICTMLKAAFTFVYLFLSSHAFCYGYANK